MCYAMVLPYTIPTETFPSDIEFREPSYHGWRSSPAAALVVATILSFCFWYVANKLEHHRQTEVSIRVHDYRHYERSIEPPRRTSESSPNLVLSLRRDSKETLDICLPAMYPKEDGSNTTWHEDIKQSTTNHTSSMLFTDDGHMEVGHSGRSDNFTIDF